MELIQDETDEWSQGAIVDVKTVNATYDKIIPNICGDGYEQVSILFLGTKDYCGYSDRSYRVGGCFRKSKGKLTYGIDQEKMNIYKDNVICIKRNSNLTYHNLIESYRKDNCGTG